VNSDSLDPRWVRTWAADITAHLQSVLSTFDAYYPFPPGENEVILAGPGPGPLEAVRPPDLVTFYEVIQEVSMSDIGNGIFIHPPGLVIAHLADGPVLLADGNTGTIFASDGGGILYAIDPGGRVHRSHSASSESDFAPVATDLRGFLGQVLDAVAHFVASGTPGVI
jgi:hypothetical protein